MATTSSWKDSSEAEEQQFKVIERQRRQEQLNLIQKGPKSPLANQEIFTTQKKSEPVASNPQIRSGNQFDKYEKRAGTSHLGNDFEYLMCAFYALNMCVNYNINDFVIATNMDNFGDFDDILLDVTFKNNSSKTFAIQLKHKDNKNNITDTNFAATSKKDDFALLKYLKTFENMNNVDNVTCVLYTNASTKIKNHHKFKIPTKTPKYKFEVEVLENNDRDLINLLSNKQSATQNMFQFKIDQREKHFNRIKQFSEQFYLFPNQSNVTGVRSTVDKMLKTLCFRDVFDSFFYFMKSWWSGKFLLTRDDVIAKLIELSLSPWTRTLSAKKENPKTSSLKEAIMTFDVTLVKHNEKDIVENIWLETKTHNDNIGKAVGKYGLGVSDVSNKQKCIALWYLNKVPLIVDVTETNGAIVNNALNLLTKSLNTKKIVLVGNVQEIDLLNFMVFENLLDLSNSKALEHHFQFIIDNFHVSIQEKPKISLRRLSQDDTKMMASISTNQLLQMSQESLVIGSREDILPKYYISRALEGVFLQTKEIVKWQSNSNDSLIIFSCNNYTVKYLGDEATSIDMLDYLRGNVRLTRHRILISISGTCSVVDFQSVCETVESSDVYLLQIIDKNCSLLLFKKGNRLPLEQLKCIHKPIQESEILKYFDNYLNVICAPPGMGKSSLFTHLSQTCPSDFWSVRVNLINYNFFFNDRLSYETILLKFLRIDDNNDTFPTSTKNGFLESKKILIFLDGLDEIDSRFVNVVLEFAKYVSSKGIRIWISTRENLRSHITKTLTIVPIEIPQLDQNQQKLYVENKLELKYKSQEIDKILEAMYTSSDLINSRQLLGVPLQLYIITENFLNHSNIYQSLNKHNVFVLTAMYRLFFEGKKQFYENKIGVNLNQIGISFNFILRQYELPALNSCLDHDDFEELIIEDRNCTEFLEQIKMHGDKFGIIEIVNEQYIAIFVHQTFAEYFACLWFKRNTNKLLQLRDKMFSDKYQNLKLMLDILLAENNPLHLAIIYQDVEQFCKKFYHVDVEDFGGRTALHLACSYGKKYSPQKDYLFDLISTRPLRDSINLIEIFHILFEKSSNIFKTDKLFQFNCIEYALKSQCFYPLELILERRLMDHKDFISFFSPESTEWVAYFASKFGYVNLLKALIAHISSFHQDLFLLGAIKSSGSDDSSSARATNMVVVHEILDWKLNKLKKHSRELRGDYILRLACRFEDELMIKILMDYGLKPINNNTILHYISRWHSDMSQKFIEFLKVNSVNVNLRNDSGDTALEMACLYGTVNNVKCLLEFGADVTVVNKHGTSIKDNCAKNYYDSKILDILLRYNDNTV